MIELDDCGKTMKAKVDGAYLSNIEADVKVQMVIKAPKGRTIALFDLGYTSPDTQCKAIRAFMEEHKDE